jgi:hypothetical protein
MNQGSAGHSLLDGLQEICRVQPDYMDYELLAMSWMAESLQAWCGLRAVQKNSNYYIYYIAFDIKRSFTVKISTSL